MSVNLLGSETSPYLLQHKDNPVWWFPWGNAAFEVAKKENKPIFLSVGYSTCHWCHVMEKDSFEKKDVAQVLNDHFISVKVDREERPDVDSLYMSAVQAMTHHGGWPMSVLMMPDGKPFWGGTFVAHDQFVDLLKRVSEIWKENQSDLFESAEKLAAFLRENSELPAGKTDELDAETLEQFCSRFEERFDSLNGGTQGAPKFPPALSLMTSLRTGRPEFLEMVCLTLDRMRRGGIYDQVGGGFHRYSVDAHWNIPHFEKMLYDNSLLTTAYLEAFQMTKKSEYAQTARETLNYVLREMTDEYGGFYSAEDADSENIEGKYYAWTENELETVLTEAEFSEIKKIFQTSSKGNFHAHKTGDEVSEKRLGPPALTSNVLRLSPDDPLPSPENKIFYSALTRLLQVREKRIHPHLDDKILTSWNGLMISAMALGGRVLEEPKFSIAAAKAANFILTKMVDEKGKLHRTFRKGESRNRAMADDYSFFIAGLLELYETDFNLKWIEEAIQLQEIQNQLFWDEKSGSFFDNDGLDVHLLTRTKNYEDNVIPSANSVSAHNLLRLYRLTENEKWLDHCKRILKAANLLLNQYPTATSKLLQVIWQMLEPAFEVAIIGNQDDENVQSFLSRLRKGFFPNVTLALYDDIENKSPVEIATKSLIPILKGRTRIDGAATFYVCQNRACRLPTTDPVKAFELLQT